MRGGDVDPSAALEGVLVNDVGIGDWRLGQLDPASNTECFEFVEDLIRRELGGRHHHGPFPLKRG
jgi:hypothetical protein